MGRIIGEKALQFFLTLILVSLFLFSLFYFLKGDSSAMILGEEISQETKDSYIAASGKSGSFITGYLSSLLRLFSFNWGKSVNGESVAQIVLTSLPVSFSLALYAFLFSFPFSLLLSITAVRRKGFPAFLCAFLSSLFLLLPSFLSSVILILVFSSLLNIFPVAGYVPLSGGYISHMRSVILPSLSLSFVNTASMLRIFRATLEENMGKPYVNSARAKGVREKDLVVKSALKPGMPVIISAVSQTVVSFFASSTVVETVFALPGMGRALVRSALSRDYSLSFVLVMIMTLIISLVLFIARIVIALLDRRGERENGKA